MYDVVVLICIMIFFQILMYKSFVCKARKQHTNDLQKCVMCAETKANDKYL